MDYGKKVMTIGGVRVTDAPVEIGLTNLCRGCVFDSETECGITNADADGEELKTFFAPCWVRRAIYIPAPESLRDAYEQTDASAHLTDVEELK